MVGLRSRWVFSGGRLIHLVLQENSLYGARFKSWTGGNGIARKYDEPPFAFPTILIELS